ncbi:hypothetical protein [Streptomyces sp. JJ36]|uniref:hypothetical protein n=1 Tax=Streptomyces sp. JJ36 TaxID=2736645 RepID=UPI001F2B8A03|nr:hypothetical protein [Streptomyces sp. JJ36]MCF6523076.1 hypothetical protein [Streptomyces sp. JJ36]
MRKSLLATVAAVASAAFTLGAGPASAAETGAASPARAQGVACSTGVHAVDPLTGFASCSNHTGGPVEFRVELVCGWAPDVEGAWVRLEPGEGSQSIAHCAAYSSGIGEVRAVHRPA